MLDVLSGELEASPGSWKSTETQDKLRSIDRCGLWKGKATMTLANKIREKTVVAKYFNVTGPQYIPRVDGSSSKINSYRIHCICYLLLLT
jgi:hypothetical protein